MTVKLFFQAIFKFLAGALILGLLLFLPAGTLHYPQGWLFLGLLLIPMLGAGLVLMAKNPELLQKRLSAREKLREQGQVIRLTGLVFIAGFLLAGFNFRYQWWILPRPITWAAALVFLLGYGLYAEVLRENTYLSRTVEVQENQTVVDTGLYGLVRHPMYAAAALIFLMMPLILGCLWSFLLFLLLPVLLAFRIRSEEAFLEANLPGYRDYEKKVRYRMIPYIY